MSIELMKLGRYVLPEQKGATTSELVNLGKDVMRFFDHTASEAKLLSDFDKGERIWVMVDFFRYHARTSSVMYGGPKAMLGWVQVWNRNDLFGDETPVYVHKLFEIIESNDFVVLSHTLESPASAAKLKEILNQRAYYDLVFESNLANASLFEREGLEPILSLHGNKYYHQPCR